jgi:hypothetical protein
MPNLPTVFVSYSHLDARYRDEVRRFLSPLVLDREIELWDDRTIAIGEDWYREIGQRLDQAKVAILLITTNFLGSSFCKLEEMPVLLQRARQRKLVVLPVLFEDCLWKRERWLARLQMLSGDKPLRELKRAARDKLLTRLAQQVSTSRWINFR